MYIKSPIHYMGNKYDLLPNILEQLPKVEEIETFMMSLVGGDVLV